VLRHQAQSGRIELAQVVLVKPDVIHYGTLIGDIRHHDADRVATASRAVLREGAGGE